MSCRFDSSVHQSVIEQFAAQSLSIGSPMQSLYMVLANKPSTLFTPIRRHFNDVLNTSTHNHDSTSMAHHALSSSSTLPTLLQHWKSNVAMMINNPTAKASEFLVHLSDTLANNLHNTEAAHLCLMGASYALEDIRARQSR